MEWFAALWEHQFLQHAAIGGLLASIACGVVGTYVVVKRISYLAGGISHAVLGGMGVAYFLNIDPMIGALCVAILSALLVGWVSLKASHHADVIIGALWSVGMAIGILFISKTPGYNVDLMSYLFGSILLIARDELYIMAGLDVAIVLIVGLLYKQLQAICFDEEFARLRGVPVELIYFVLLLLVALTVVVLIQVVGLILVIALLTLPAAIAGQYLSSLGKIMVAAVLLGMFFVLGGLFVSFEPDLPSGATIILIAGLSYLFSTGLQLGLRRMG